MIKKDFLLSASIVCDDFYNLGKTIKSLEKGPIDFIHYDVMDGVFVPRYGLLPEMLQTIRNNTKLPVDVHMMVENPEPYIEPFAKAGANIITVHVEGNLHLSRTVKLIKDFSCKVGLALNPATGLNVLDYLLDDIDMVMLMAINPGIVGHQLIPNTYQKIKDVKQVIGDRNVLIEIDGGVTPESSSKMISSGADMLVCGTSTIFKQKQPLEVMIKRIRKKIRSEIKNEI